MKILVASNTSNSDYFIEKFLNDPRVSHVYHCDAHPAVSTPTDRYTPISTTSIAKDDREKMLSDSIRIPGLDLIVTNQLGYQLSRSFHDELALRGVPYICPEREIGFLEWSKVYSKRVFKELGIPTPDHIIVKGSELIEKFPTFKRPFVLKYDQDYRVGMQTIIVTDDNWEEELKRFTDGNGFKSILNMLYKTDYNNLNFIIEEFVEGAKEYSYHVICNSTGIKYIGSARDYKQMYEDDKGCMTDGVGCYSVTDVNDVAYTYAEKIHNYFKSKNIVYKGFMFLGIIVDKDNNPLLLEVNTRLGEPEGLTILSLIENNLLDLMIDIANNNPLPEITFSDKKSVCIRLTNKNWPTVGKNCNFPNITNIPEGISYYRMLSEFGYRIYPYSFLTVGNTIEECSSRIYNFLSQQELGDYYYRKDIGLLK